MHFPPHIGMECPSFKNALKLQQNSQWQLWSRHSHCTLLTIHQHSTLHCLHLDFTAARCVPTWNPLLTVSVPNGSDCWEHHVSYLLDGFQCGDCGERCGSHFSNVHIHITAVFADSQHGIFFRNVFGLLDIFRALFNLRLAVHNCVCHCIRVISILLLERRGGGNKSRFWIELKLIPLASPSCSLG